MVIILLFATFLILSSAETENVSKETPSQHLTNDTGTFWQFTDVHWDLRYARNGNPNNMCHWNESSEEYQNGYFGNYLCDAPWSLIESAMLAMKNIQNKPDFILWTGDNTPHSRDPPPGFDVIFRTVSNLTQELRTRFADIPIIPVLGNHDTYPKDDFPVNNDTFYEDYLIKSGWTNILNEEARKEFSAGGYFSFRISANFSVLSVNTNLYYEINTLGTKTEDPAGQFAWMKSKFDAARSNNEKVLLAAHAPPGFWERNGKVPFLNETYNDVYVNLLRKYGDVIVAQIYGHEHTDTFRVFNNPEVSDKGSVAFLAPSLTPWFPPGGTAINPSVRLYSYNSSNILDYHQYHFNLTEANNNNKVNTVCNMEATYDPDSCEKELANLWKLYYNASTIFSTSVLNFDGMASFLRRLQSDDDLVQKLYRINSAGVVHSNCDTACRRTFLCAIDHLLIADFQSCVASRTSDQCYSSECFESMGAHMLVAGIVATISLTIMLGIMLIIVLARRRKTIRLGSSTTEFEWANRHRGYRPLSGDGD